MSRAEPTVVVGQVTRTHGVRGDVYVRDDSDNPERFTPGQRFRTTNDDISSLVVRAVREGPHGLIVAFAGITSIEAAETLVGAELLIPAHRRRPLESNEYWPDQLVGLAVHDASGPIGVVEDIVLGPQDRLIIRLEDGRTGELPFVEELVPDLAIDEGWLRIEPPDGLFSRR